MHSRNAGDGAECRRREASEGDAVHPDRAADVLQFRLAEILEGEAKPAGGAFLHARRHANAARLGQRLEAGGDIYAVAGGLHDAALVIGGFRIDEIAA